MAIVKYQINQNDYEEYKAYGSYTHITECKELGVRVGTTFCEKCRFCIGHNKMAREVECSAPAYNPPEEQEGKDDTS